MNIPDITKKISDDAELSREEITNLFNVPLFSRESFEILAAAREKSEKACNGLAEVHAQFGLNVGPCSVNCIFCSFAKCNGIFTENSELPLEEAIARTKRFEEDGANAICIMATGHYPFKKYLEVSLEVRKHLKSETVLYANVGDLSPSQAKELKDAGHAGIYHVVRMGEGIDTPMSPQRRMETIRNAKEAGLFIGTCVEPIGPEHTVEELVEKTIMTREIKPIFSGAMRRVPIPNTEKAKYGIVSEARMAHILGVVRLAVGLDVPGHCTHEPGIMAATTGGANLLWAETGSNPRDTEKDTEGYRGWTVKSCKNVFTESEWGILDGPSKFSLNVTQHCLDMLNHKNGLRRRTLWMKKSDMDINSFAPCGLICGLCKDIHRECSGCRYGGGDQNCYQLNCCKTKGIAGCWECKSFPCNNGYLGDEKWKGIIRGFAKCIRVVGPDKFYNDVKYKLGSSINYHEYTSISEKNIISMFYD